MKGRILSIRAMKSILKDEGAKVISLKGAGILRDIVEEFARKVSRKAVKKALFDGRKTVKKEDF